MKTAVSTRAALAAIWVSIPATLLFLVLALILAPGIFFVLPPDQPLTFGNQFLAMLGSTEGMILSGVLVVIISIAGWLSAVLANRSPARRRTGSSARKPAPTVTPTGVEEEGVVKWFNVNKGFGFITRPSGEEIFVHFRNIQGTGKRVLRQGQAVRYQVMQGDKGPQADQVVADRN